MEGSEDLIAQRVIALLHSTRIHEGFKIVGDAFAQRALCAGAAFNIQ